MSETRSARKGPPVLAPEVKRNVTVSLRMNEFELEWLDSERAKRNMQRGPFMREAAMHNLPPTIPELNLKAWRELAKSLANLNQIAKTLNQSGAGTFKCLGETLKENQAQLKAIRRALLGAESE